MSVALQAILLDHCSAILLLVDPATLAIREASKPALRILGYSREALLGRPITDIECSLADTHFWEEARRRGGAAARNAESGYLRADGEILPTSRTVTRVAVEGRHWLVIHAEPLRSGRRLEDRMPSAPSLLRATLEATADGILLIDRNGAIVNMNRRFARMWGLPDELLARRDDGAVFGFMAALVSEPQAYQAGLERIAQDAEGETFDLLHLADGRYFVRKSMPARHGSHILGRVYSYTDVTARKRAEEALRLSEEQFRKAFDVSPDSININRLEDGLYVSVNSGFTRIMGYSRAEIIGRTPAEFGIWADPGDRLRLIEGLRQNGAVENLEAKFRTKDGAIRIGLMSAALIEIAGVQHSINVTRDITEQRQAERARAQLELQLRESQKMEALGTLAGGIAHDFNNIVATIMGNAELARLDLAPEHAAQESLEEIRKASRRAKDLVQQILAFGRRQVLERRVTALAPVVQETARLLRSTLPAATSLSVRCAPDAPKVLADATQVEQVLLNLCTNAWQAMQGRERPGLIEISLDAHCAAGEEHRGPEHGAGRVVLYPGRYARLTVRDNGPGMDAATRERIFDPFFTTKPVGEGTGLGLAVVHGIAQGHEAKIEVQSAPGLGASFSLYFPEAAADPAVAAPPPAAAPEPGAGGHILCIDDDESIVFLMARLLERQGYQVSGYTDPLEALAAVAAAPGRFDLAVTDYNMPGMSGLDLARALREIRADLPIALASGLVTEELRAAAPAAGIIELIYKPNTVDELCAVIARLAAAQRGRENSS
jgi:PAS domain S-box-containing protein